MGLLVGYLDSEFFLSQEKELIERTLFYLNTQKIPLNTYIFKIECCSLLKQIAIKSNESCDYRIGSYFHVHFPFDLKRRFIRQKS